MKRNHIFWAIVPLSVLALFLAVLTFAKVHQEKNANYDLKRPGSCFRTCVKKHSKCTKLTPKCVKIFSECKKECSGHYSTFHQTRIIKEEMEAHEPKVVGPRAYFRFKLFPKILREECGKCKTLCHYDPKDRGGLTCAGVAINHNQKWFVDSMNKLDTCKVNFNSKLVCDKGTLRQHAFELYYKKYGKTFEKCPRGAFDMLVDSAILSGVGTSTKLLQRSAGIKVDGKFGPASLKACNSFNAKRFTQERIKRFKRLKQCKRYCRGWIIRAQRVLKDYDLTKGLLR